MDRGASLSILGESMLLDSLQDTIQDALDASEDADFYEVERCLRQATQTVLQLRIEDHCKAKHYELALKDAQSLVALSPSSPDGYIWAGKIWSEALYFSKAAETYSAALKAVEKPEAQFGPLYKEAVAKRDRKMDPLSYLPGELIIRIFGYLADMRMTCTYVSKTWRRLLLALPLWKHLMVGLTHQRASGYWQRGLESYLQPHLEELTLSCKNNLCTVVSMLNAADCYQLRRVVLHDEARYAPDTTVDGKWSFFDRSLYTSIGNLSSQMTQLFIVTSMMPRNVLPLLLSLCPRLTLLSYALEGDTYELLPFDCTPLPTPQVTDLRDLAWPDLVDVVSDPSLLSRCCPYLRCVTLGDESGKRRRMTDVSALVHQLQRGCKYLEELYFEPDVCYSPDTIALDNDRHSPHSTHARHALRSVYISAKTWVNPDTFSALITSNVDTLQDIVYRSAVRSDDMPESLNGRQHDLRFPELRVLDLAGSVPSVIQPLASFVQNCPVLEDVTLAGIELETAGLMDALLQARLQRLWLNTYQGSARVALRFVAELAHRGASSSLTDLSIATTTPQGQWENVFVMAGAIPRLERLRFILPAPALTKDAIARFVDKARRSGAVSSLKSLKIVTEQDDAPEIIKPAFTSLKELMCVRPH